LDFKRAKIISEQLAIASHHQNSKQYFSILQ